MKIFKYLFFTALCLFVVGILLLPTFLSSSWGIQKIVALTTREQESVRVESASFSWIGDQKIEGFAYKNPKKGQEFTFEALTLNSSLLRYLFSPNSLGKGTLVNPYLKMTKQAGENAKPPVAGALPIIASGELHIENGRVDLEGWERPVQLTGLSAILANPGGARPLEIFLKGETGFEKTEGYFEVTLSSNNVEDLSNARFKARGELSNFPSSMLDAFGASGLPPSFFQELLGDLFNFQGALTTTGEEQNFAFTVNSLKGEGGAVGAWNKKGLTLKEPARFSWSLSPNLAPKTSRFVPEGDAEAKLELTALVVDFATPLTPENLEGTLEVSKAAFTLDSKFYALSDVSISSISPSREVQEIFAKGVLNYGKSESASFSSQTSLNRMTKTLSSLSGEAQNFPTSLVATFTSPELDHLGESLQIDWKVKEDGGLLRGEVKGKSPFLTLSKMEFLLGDSLKLLSPVDFTFTPNRPYPFLPYPVQGKIEGSLSSLQMPLPSKDFDFMEASFRLSGKTELLSLAGLPAESPFQTAELKEIEIQKQPGKQATFEGALSLKQKQRSLISPYLSGECALDFSGLATLKEINSLDINARFDNAKAQTRLSLQDSFQLLKGINETRVTVDFPSTAFPELKDTPSARLVLEPFQIDLRLPLLNQLALSGIGTTDRIAPRFTEGTLEQTGFRFSFDAPQNTLSARLNAIPILPKGDKGSLEIEITASDFLEEGGVSFENAYIESLAKMDKFTPNILSPLLGNLDLEPIFGPDIALTYLLQVNNLLDNPTGTVNYTVEGSYLESEGALKIGQTVENDGLITLNGILTPELMQIISGRLNLAVNAPYAATIESLSLPQDDLLNSSFKGSLKVGALDLDQVVFQSTFAKITSPNLRERISVELTSRSLDQATKEIGSLNLRMNVENLPENGAQWITESDVECFLDMQAFPLSAFSEVLTTNLYTRDLMRGITAGELTSGHFDTDLKEGSGQAKLFFDNPNSKLGGSFKIRSGVISLDAPLQGQFKLTPSLIDGLLSKLNPIFRSALPGEDLIELTINPEGTFYDLTAYEPLKTATFSFCKLDVGSLRFKREGIIGDILTLVGYSRDRKSVDVRFTPFYASMNKGIFKQYREDFLVEGRFPMAFWGNIDLPREYVDMILGIDAWTLEQISGAANFPETYMMLVPIKGGFGKVEIDTTKTLARLAALKSQSFGDDTLRTVGSIFNVITAPKEERGDIPAPMTNPLPWKEEIEAMKEQTSRRKSPQKEVIQKPVNTEDEAKQEIVPFNLPKLFR